MKLPVPYDHGVEGEEEVMDETIINSPELREAVTNGNIVATRLRERTKQIFLDWLELGASFHILHRAAMERSGANTPHGPVYRTAFTKLIAQTQFGDLLDKSARSKLLFLYEHQEEVLLWWNNELMPAQRMKWHHPATVWKEFTKRDRMAKKPKAEEKAKAELDDTSEDDLDEILTGKVRIGLDAAANVEAIVRAVGVLLITPEERSTLLKDMAAGLRKAV